MSLLDWKEFGRDYAAAMAVTAKALAEELVLRGVPVHATGRGITTSHQFAIEAARYGGGQKAAKLLRRAHVLTCGIGLPIAPVEGDANGLRLGTPEIVRFGMNAEHMKELAGFIAEALGGNRAPEEVGRDVTAFRRRFTRLHYLRS
jgi:glycine hydroxymethyltransferase